MAGDLQLTCSDCGREFTFTAADQTFFQERGYSTPKRCKPCRQAKKADQAGGGGGFGGGSSYGGGGGGGGYSSRATTGTAVVCSGCGQQTTVPFEPRGDRPVFCRDCFQAQKGGAGGGGGGRGRGGNDRGGRGGGGGGRY
jgi:CxxC-x17-CxxC domain-containing protein